MLPFLHDVFFTPDWPFVVLRLFKYPVVCAMGAALGGFLLCTLLTAWFVRVTNRRRLWEQTRSFSLLAIPSKRRVPTMGGTVIIATVVLNMLLWCRLADPQVWLLMGVLLFLGAAGMWDDRHKIARGRGLSRAAKYAVCAVYAGAVLWFALSPSFSPFAARNLRWEFFLPFLKDGFDLGLCLIPALALFLVYAANAVNLTDGMDGLASVPVVLVAGVLSVMAYVLSFQEYVDYLLFFPTQSGGQTVYRTLPSANLHVACAGLAGAVTGFLWHNAYPATVIMGDTGSLALGGALGTVAVLLKQEALFLLAGGVFLLETASSFVQDVIGIRIFGRRLLYRAPLHDALLYRGTGESKVTVRLWLLSAMLAVLALTSLKLR